MPKKGLAAEPGLSLVQGSGVTRMAPVSVCHHVSMIGSLPPVTRWNHSLRILGSVREPINPEALPWFHPVDPGHRLAHPVQDAQAAEDRLRLPIFAVPP